MAETGAGRRAVMRLLTAGVGAAMLAWAYHSRRAGPDDPVAAVALVAMRFPALRADIGIEQHGPACDGGDAAACVALGESYARVRDDGAPLPPCLDHRLFRRACDGRDWRGCVEVARTARRGDCGSADLEQVRDVLDFACKRMVFAACDAKADL